MPAEIEALHKAMGDAKEPEERSRRAEAFSKAHGEWQREWNNNPASYVAYLLVDGKLEGEYLSGTEARAAAQRMEPKTKPYTTSMTLDGRTTEMTFPGAPLRWRTE
jgi:hypothetical protein